VQARFVVIMGSLYFGFVPGDKAQGTKQHVIVGVVQI
jgi:hypothetical protein